MDGLNIEPGKMNEHKLSVMGKLNKRNPHELHWRQEPPKWDGNLNKAYLRHYSHIVDHVHCLHCGAIPCPLDHSEDKRQRLVDLNFVKELAREKKELEKQLAKLEKDMEDLKRKAQEWKTERLLLLQELRDHEKLRKEWQYEKSLMEAEIKRLRNLTDKQTEQLNQQRKTEAQLRIMTLKAQALEEENQNLKEENKKFRQMIIRQSEEIQTLSKTNKDIRSQFEESQRHVNKLKLDIDQLSENIQHLMKGNKDKDNKIKTLQQEMQQLINDIAEQARIHQEKELRADQLLAELRQLIMSLKSNLAASEKKNREMELQIVEYLQEIERLKKKLANDSRFRQFVDVKREVNNLRDKNEVLMTKLSDDHAPALPAMVKSGRVKSAVRVTYSTDRVLSARHRRGIRQSQRQSPVRVRTPNDDDEESRDTQDTAESD